MPILHQNQMTDMLSRAVRDGNLAVAEELLRRGADPNAAAQGFPPPINEAVRIGEKMVRLLLDFGANPNDQRAVNDMTPLHDAAVMGDAKTALLLLQRGADPALKNFSGKTAEDLAAMRLNSPLKPLFEDTPAVHAPPLRAADRKGAGLPVIPGMLLLAVKAGAFATAQDLLARKADPNETDTLGNSVLRYGIEAGTEMINLLLDNKADIDFQNSMGHSALSSATCLALFAEAELLIARGCNLDLVCSQNKTALDWAKTRHADDFVKLLEKAPEERKRKAEEAEQARMKPVLDTGARLSKWRANGGYGQLGPS